MAYGDPNYNFVVAGSTGASAATAHNLYGTYGGLSQLNAKEVLLIQIGASVGDLNLSPGPATPATNNIGLTVFTSDPILSLPPMLISDASQITFANLSTTNATANWAIWRRNS